MLNQQQKETEKSQRIFSNEDKCRLIPGHSVFDSVYSVNYLRRLLGGFAGCSGNPGQRTRSAARLRQTSGRSFRLRRRDILTDLVCSNYTSADQRRGDRFSLLRGKERVSSSHNPAATWKGCTQHPTRLSHLLQLLWLEAMFRNTFQSGFLSILYSIG